MLLETVGKNKIRFQIDAFDFLKVSLIKWGASFISGKWYVRFAWNEGGKTKTIYLHRYILNAEKGVLVDHINLDALDNRRENLRKCAKAENCRNSALSKNNTSGFKGVSSTKEGNWRASIMLNYRTISLGTYADKSSAYKAYCEAACKYHKEFARF